jgi:hypothetical protein
LSSYLQRSSKASRSSLLFAKGWDHAKATAWDNRWQALSVKARQAYLDPIKPATRTTSAQPVGVAADRVPADALAELENVGLVRVAMAPGARKPRAFAHESAYDFSTRLRTLQRVNLLGPYNVDNLLRFLRFTFDDEGLAIIDRILVSAGIRGYRTLLDSIDQFVISHRWPGWAAEASEAKLADPIVKELAKSGPLTYDALTKRLKQTDPAPVRAAVSTLQLRLAAFEDLDPKTLEIVVGLLPVVRESWKKASLPRSQPSLVKVETPARLASPGGMLTADLRAFLLELSAQPPKLRRDGGIFQTETSRFLAALTPWLGWVDQALRTNLEERVERAEIQAKFLRFVKIEEQDGRLFLVLTPPGREWLALPIEEQYQTLYAKLRDTARDRRDYDEYHVFTYADTKFLGLDVVVTPVQEGSRVYYHDPYDLKPEHRESLRKAIHRALQALPVGTFFTFRSVVDYLSFGETNPIVSCIKGKPSKVMLHRGWVPDLPERIEEAGKTLWTTLIRDRLIAWDAMALGIDPTGEPCVARLPRLDGYFGDPYEIPPSAMGTSSKVIVQPDFSVLVIGPDPAPSADLAPFCERGRGHAGEGAIIYKLTRESVTRGAGQGLTAGQIIARLEKYASVAIPANVLSEIRDWVGRIRLVNVVPMTVIRCPDEEAVARVVTALGKHAERLSDTLAAIDMARLTPADRQKLKNHGILVTTTDIRKAKPAEPKAAKEAASEAPVKRRRGRPPKQR